MKREQFKEYCDAEFENIDAVSIELFSVVKNKKSIYQHRYKSRVVVFMVTKAVISKTTLLKNLPSPLFTKEGDYTHLHPSQEGISLPLVKGVYPPLAAPKATRG
jgi:hypothetical protein